MSFDMDMHIKKEQVDKPLYAVVMKKKSKFFIIMKKGDPFLPNILHGIGFWATEIPNLDTEITIFKQILEDQEYVEVWIPYENIDYVKSLIYKKK